MSAGHYSWKFEESILGSSPLDASAVLGIASICLRRTWKSPIFWVSLVAVIVSLLGIVLLTSEYWSSQGPAWPVEKPAWPIEKGVQKKAAFAPEPSAQDGVHAAIGHHAAPIC